MKGPICNICDRRPAREHPVVGWYKLCELCRSRRKSFGANNPICGQCLGPKTPTERFCSTVCKRANVRKGKKKNKDRVVNALGGKCSCRSRQCPAHRAKECGISHIDLLTVEHTRRNGNQIRRNNGRNKQGRSGNIWSRYGRALDVPGHGMRLLCHNCHHWVESKRFKADIKSREGVK